MKIKVRHLYLALALLATSFGMPSCDSDDDDDAKPDTEVKGDEEGGSSSEQGGGSSEVGGKIAKASEAVDLGLSVKWAPWNVGASSAAEAGAYFAWGETTAKSVYGWSQYKWMVERESTWEYISKYQAKDGQTSADWYNSFGEFIGDGKTTLDASDDAATVNWGGKWRMPTQAELLELFNNCKWTWKAENEYAEGSLAGYLVTGPNGNSLFLPAAGDRWYSDLSSLGSYGRYWSSELNAGNSDYARYLDFYSVSRYANSNYSRFSGFSVRAVLSAAE